jgi:epoxyqueuosine reductase
MRGAKDIMPNQVIIDKAKELGFIAVGFARPDTPMHFDHFRRWLQDVELGDMSYLERNRDIREDPTKLLEGVQTIISLAYPYPAEKPSTQDGYTTSRYSTPDQDDYHLRLRQIAKNLRALISMLFPGSLSRVCVDSAPLLERSFAAASGIGFIGKNNMLIVPGYGSYCYLVEILTTAKFPIPEVKVPETLCGSCTRCVDSCPTGALEVPFFINVTRCLSYLTIEYKGDIDRQAAGIMGNTFFGCDVCQEVCPFNAQKQTIVSMPATKDILAMDESDFKKTFGRTAFERTGLEKLKANIRLLIKEKGESQGPVC